MKWVYLELVQKPCNDVGCRVNTWYGDTGDAAVGRNEDTCLKRWVIKQVIETYVYGQNKTATDNNTHY